MHFETDDGAQHARIVFVGRHGARLALTAEELHEILMRWPLRTEREDRAGRGEE
jgi:hypothetical protein